MKAWQILLAVLGLGVLWLVLVSAHKRDVAASVTPAEAAANAIREQRWEITLGAAVTLRKAARNPDSFVVEQALQMPDGADCFRYRAQNGFGGMNREYAVLSLKRDKLLTSSDDGFAGIWREECAGKAGDDKTEDLEYAFKTIDARNFPLE